MQMTTNTRLQQVLPGPGQLGRIVNKKNTYLFIKPLIMTNSNDSSSRACGNQHARITNNLCPSHWRYGYVRNLHLENLVIFPILITVFLGTWVTDGFQATLCLPRMFPPHFFYSLPFLADTCGGGIVTSGCLSRYLVEPHPWQAHRPPRGKNNCQSTS